MFNHGHWHTVGAPNASAVSLYLAHTPVLAHVLTQNIRIPIQDVCGTMTTQQLHFSQGQGHSTRHPIKGEKPTLLDFQQQVVATDGFYVATAKDVCWLNMR